MTVHDLPIVNASLNAISGVLLLIGYILIRRGRRDQHRACMIAAFVTSSIFLASCPVYFPILITHVTLAAAVLPLAVITLSQGLMARFRQHRTVARWTFPIWLYVSVTGVLVYVLLYQPTWLL
jgi:uncharacterized membrane protein YozB (DUF420 family)